MNTQEFKTLIQSIVIKAVKLRDSKTTAHEASVNYVCVFSQTETEYQSFIAIAEGK